MQIKQLLSIFLTACAFIGCHSGTSGSVVSDSLIPHPVRFEKQKGHFTFDNQTVIGVENAEQAAVANLLAGLFTSAGGFTPQVKTDVPDAAVLFLTDTTLATENYRMEIDPQHITIRSGDAKGFFYAVQSLRMMLPPEIESKDLKKGMAWKVEAAILEDGPRFSYRGLMLDVSRFFIPKENVLKIIDCMGMMKLNYLHLHLVDDNGWRLEIKKYPKLTEIGAWRVQREGDHAQQRNPQKGEPTPVGGFYTQEDIRELVKYAAERQIEIIPEIEMPAHTVSSLAAYPELTCPVVKDFIGVLPGLGGHAAEIVYCAGNEKVFTFLQDVIDEVVTLFPSPYLHLGGDEASKENWKKCPLCQARMKAEGITDAEDLQSYFMKRMSKYVRSKGKQVMGWDELTHSELPEGAVIYGWQGLGNSGYKAGTLGHKFIMTPAKVLYLIRYQGPQWFEPRTYFGNNTLKDVYEYEPVRPDWDPAAADNLLGVQASLWTEFVTTPKGIEYLLFPRLAALAEVAWSPEESKNWPLFLQRLDVFTRRLSEKGIDYARSMYNIDHLVTGHNDTLQVALSCIRPDMEIRYTTDGTAPTVRSSLYTDTLRITSDLTMQAATFARNRQQGKTLILPLHFNKATTKPVFSDNIQAYRIVNGLRGSDKHTDFEWCGWYGKDASFIIDLGKSEPIRKVTVGCITNYGMAVHIPAAITLFVSDDNNTYVEIGKQIFTPEQIFKEGIRIEDKIFDFSDITGRYLKIELKNPGKCPPDHIRPDENSWVYIDEVSVH